MNDLRLALLCTALAVFVWLLLFTLPYVVAVLVIVAAYTLAGWRALRRKS